MSGCVTRLPHRQGRSGDHLEDTEFSRFLTQDEVIVEEIAVGEVSTEGEDSQRGGRLGAGETPEGQLPVGAHRKEAVRRGRRG